MPFFELKMKLLRALLGASLVVQTTALVLAGGKVIIDRTSNGLQNIVSCSSGTYEYLLPDCLNFTDRLKIPGHLG